MRGLKIIPIACIICDRRRLFLDLPVFLMRVRWVPVVVAAVRVRFHPFGVRRQWWDSFRAHRTNGAVRVATRVTVLHHGRGAHRVVARHRATGAVHHPLNRVHATLKENLFRKLFDALVENIIYILKKRPDNIRTRFCPWVLTVRSHRRVHELQVVVVQDRRQKSIRWRGHFVIVVL